MKSIIQVAIEAAQQAGSSIQLAAQDLSSLNIEQKSLHDYVSDVDRNAEKIVTQIIKQHFPSHQILGEEFGLQGQTDSEYQWIIDPLDGTTNFLRSIPHYAVSIAIMKNNEPEHAVIYDPAKKELFTASKNQGAFLDGKPINVTQLANISGALLSTGVPYSGVNLSKVDAFSNTMVGLLEKQTSGIRRLGAAALDLAYVAAGRYDGFWEANLNIWDIAAGVLIVQEAGGVVTDLLGDEDYFACGDVLAAPKGVHRDMLDVTKVFYSEK